MVTKPNIIYKNMFDIVTLFVIFEHKCNVLTIYVIL